MFSNYPPHQKQTAVNGGNVELVKLVLEAGTKSINLQNQKGISPISAAAGNGNAEIIQVRLYFFYFFFVVVVVVVVKKKISNLF